MAQELVNQKLGFVSVSDVARFGLHLAFEWARQAVRDPDFQALNAKRLDMIKVQIEEFEFEDEEKDLASLKNQALRIISDIEEAKVLVERLKSRTKMMRWKKHRDEAARLLEQVKADWRIP